MSKNKNTATANPHVAILAGAGTGKTTRIIREIAALIKSKDASSTQILTVTFSRRATNELRQRLRDELGAKADGITISTFHAHAARIVRTYGNALGFDPTFTILETPDVKTIIRRIIREEDLSGTFPTTKAAFEVVERHKCAGHMPKDITTDDQYTKTVRRLYTRLQAELLASNSMTYSDLILYALHLLKKQPKARQEYSGQFQFIFVDEFQDTNIAQYKLLKRLAGDDSRLFAVGDDDQSIFSWRYVPPGMMDRFIRDYGITDCKRLTKNHRSTATIVNAANSLISHNTDRRDKKLVPTKPDGHLIKVKRFVKQEEEAKWIADNINKLRENSENEHKTVAILCRYKELFRKIEKQLRDAKIEYYTFGQESLKRVRSSRLLPDFLDAMMDNIDSEDTDDNKVHLMTMHAAKGLQFDYVFLPAWEHKRVPDRRSPIEEERRLAYVAVTRAKEQLFISSVLENRDGVKIKFKVIKPSCFINELSGDYIDKRRSKAASAWLHNKRNYVEPTFEIEVDDIVSHNPYTDDNGDRINHGICQVIGVPGANIEIKLNDGNIITVKKASVTKVLLPKRRKKKQKKG